MVGFMEERPLIRPVGHLLPAGGEKVAAPTAHLFHTVLDASKSSPSPSPRFNGERAGVRGRRAVLAAQDSRI